MKKRIGILFLSMVLLATVVFAAYPEEEGGAENPEGLIVFNPTEDDVSIDIVEDDLYEMNKEVTLGKIVDGNVHIMAEKVKIDGAVIYGNVFVMAREIEITNSDVRGSIYAMGESIRMSAQTNDLYAMGNMVILEEDGSIWRDAKIGANQLEAKGKVERNLFASVDKLNVAETAAVGGKLNYYSNKEGTIAETAQLGEVEFTKATEKENHNSAADYMMSAVEVMFKTLVISFIIWFFIRKFSSLPRENTGKNVLQLIGKGAGVLILVPVVAILLIMTSVGATLGVCLLAFYSVLLFVSTTVTALEIATRIVKQENNKVKLVGFAILISIVIWAIGFIPRIGSIVQFILVLMGLGVLCDLMFKRIKN